MYFILSKVFLFLLCPFYWVLALFIIAILIKHPKRKKHFFIAGIVVLYVFSNSFLFNQFAQRWDIPNQPLNPPDQKYSCAIVLGGFSSSDEQGGGFFNNRADRFIQGVKLIETKKVSHLLITGGNGNLQPRGFREATWVKTQLHDFNIPDSAVLIESNSKNTIENARFSKILLDKSHLQAPYLLVTSAFHMRRSLMIFRKAGIPVIPYPCNYLIKNAVTGIDDFIPNPDTLTNWNLYIKEVVGYMVNFFS
jgi:uncharacterized SAM-binding protein YcdF (DUF218 family)